MPEERDIQIVQAARTRVWHGHIQKMSGRHTRLICGLHRLASHGWKAVDTLVPRARDTLKVSRAHTQRVPLDRVAARRGDVPTHHARAWMASLRAGNQLAPRAHGYPPLDRVPARRGDIPTHHARAWMASLHAGNQLAPRAHENPPKACRETLSMDAPRHPRKGNQESSRKASRGNGQILPREIP